LPTYNEADNLAALVADLFALDLDLRVIIVDDNSPDGTGAIADALAEADPRVLPVHRARKLGLGTAYVAGFRAALRLDVDRVLTLDADFSHHPRYVPAVHALTQHADLGIGSRYVAGGGTLNWGPERQLLSSAANRLARSVLGLPARDCTAGFRCYRRRVLESIDLDAILSNGYSFLIEMLYRVAQSGFRVAETPILFEDRRHGVSKISRQEIARAAATVARLAWERGSASVASARRARRGGTL
jgi:glycosyltransferase involved in cell wall biosynthesis